MANFPDAATAAPVRKSVERLGYMTQPRTPDNSDEKKPPAQRQYQPMGQARPPESKVPPAAPRSQPPASDAGQRPQRPPQLPQRPPAPGNMFKVGDKAFEPNRPARRATIARPKINFKPGATIGYIAVAILVIVLLGGTFVATRLVNFVGGISVSREDTSGNVVQNPGLPGRGRVNIILLGLDRRPNDGEGTRSDSMLLLSIDQDSQTANMMSIPRDLWVKVPGYGNNRINTSYFFGDQTRPGKGGPPLVKETLKQNFGVEVHYFVEIDFNGFRSIIDALGGVIIDVKKPLIDYEYPTEDFGIKRLYIPAGLQRMNGQTALEYARSRHADSDIGRNQRQQEVLLAIREQGINLGLLTNTQLQNALIGTVKTDMTAGDIFSLGRLAATMRRDTIKQFSIDANITRNSNIGGSDVLTYDQETMRQLWQQFLAPGAK
jgi:polyisoprenyl-teichoic acid--peptidoglycan teichoic acid transferase